MKTSILDLIDFEKVDTLLEGFTQTTGFVCGILDLEGNVLSKSGWRQICTEFHRIHPETSKKCATSDTILAGKVNEGEKYHFYKCLNGLVDVAVPIVIKGQHIANLFSGQFFLEEPDVLFFKNQAKKYGFNEDIYLKALWKVPVISEEKVKLAMDFLQNMTHFISEMAFQKMEQMELNESLRKTEERYRLVLENSMDAILLTSPDGTTLSANQAACAIFQRSEEEICQVGKNGLVDMNDARFSILIEERNRNGRVKGELLMLRKDGTRFPVELSSSIFADQSGQLRASMIIRDITERKLAEKTLQESEETYRMLFESISDAVIVSQFKDDKSLKYLNVNDTACSMYGYTREEFLAKAPNDILLEKSKKTFLDRIQTLLNNEYTIYETEHITKDGIPFPVEISTRTSQVGNKIIFHSVVRDISKRKLVEKELLKLSRAVQQSPNSIVITGIDGTIKYVNPITLKLTGYTYEELIGQTPRIFSSGETSSEQYQLLWETILSGNEWEGEFHNKRKNGELFWESAMISPIVDETGEIINFLAIKRDVTESKRQALELIAAKEHAEESDRLKSAFLANMSHEIRTPLNSIIGFSDLLNDPEYDQDQKSGFTENIINNGNNLLVIISDILDLSMIESGQMKIKNEHFSVLKLLEELENEYKRKASDKGIELRLAISPHCPEIIIENDKYRIRQILVNFISNALKFTSHGFVELGFSLQDKQLLFHVKDTGIGIDVENIQSVFDRFRQVETTKTRRYGGNGLGLAISKHLAELCGGTIEVESEFRIGSTFYFSLPISL